MAEDKKSEKVKKASVSPSLREAMIDDVLKWKFTQSGAEFIVKVGEFSDEVKHLLMLHGAKQKLSDSYANSEPSEAQGFFEATLDTLSRGLWTERATGEKEEPVEILAKAVVAAYAAKGVEKVYDDVLAKINGYDQKARRNLRANPEVAEQLLKLKKVPEAAAKLEDLI